MSTWHDEAGLSILTFVGVLVQWVDVGAINDTRVADDASSVVQCALSLLTAFEIGSCTCTEIV